MSDPIKHHYLPECYLRRFLGKGEVFWVYNREWSSFKYKTPGAFGYRHHLYSLPAEGGGYDTTLETSFHAMENGFPELVERLERRLPITTSDFDHLHGFAVTMFARGVPMIDSISAAASTIAVPSLRRMFGTKEKVASMLEGFHRAHPEQERLSPEEVIQYLDSMQDAIVPHARVLDWMLEYTQVAAAAFKKKRFTVLHAPSPKQFLSNDRPAMVLTRVEGMRPGAIFSPLVDIFLPLSTRCALLLNTEYAHGEHVDLSGRLLNRLNIATAQASYQYVIGARRRDLEIFVKRAQIRGKVAIPTLRVGAEDLERALRDLGPDWPPRHPL